MVLTLATTASLFALHRLEAGRPRGMAGLFWLGVSLSILAKGPPGPIVVFGALLVLALSGTWRGTVASAVKSGWWWLLALPIAWFVLAIRHGGPEYLEGTVLPEVVDRALGTGSRAEKAQPYGVLPLLFAVRFAPWSLVAILAGVQTWRGRRDPEERGGLHLVSAWTFAGLAIFSLSRGQREDYLLPLLPAASLLTSAFLGTRSEELLVKPWRLLLALAAGAGLVLAALSALELFPRGDISGPGRLGWSLSLLAASALVAAGAAAARHRGGGRAVLSSLLAAAAAGSLLMLAYFHTLSPEARSRRGRDLEVFAALVEAERREGDDLRYSGVVGNGIRFLLGLDLPPWSAEEIETRVRPLAGGRLLVIADSMAMKALLGAKPDRFRVIVDHRHGRDDERLYLLESRG